jgi:hypothetical protein
MKVAGEVETLQPDRVDLWNVRKYIREQVKGCVDAIGQKLSVKSVAVVTSKHPWQGHLNADFRPGGTVPRVYVR